jgi:hypothetical protein
VTGAEHFAESERLTTAARGVIKDADDHREQVLAEDDAKSVRGREAIAQWLDAHGAARNLIELGHVHATLSLASAVEKQTRYAHGLDTGGYGARHEQWEKSPTIKATA